MRRNNPPSQPDAPAGRPAIGPRSLFLGSLLCVVGVICGWTSVPARAQDEQAVFQQLIRDHGDTVVSIKLVLKIKGGAFGPDGQQFEQDTSGLMIDPTGLVLASSNEMGGVPPALKQFIAQMGEMSIEPTDIKILIGSDPKEYEAEIVTRDSELDLAWVRIKSPGDNQFTAMDLSDSAECRLGQKLVVVDRANKYFDRAPVAEEFRIAGITTKPRRLYVPNTVLGSGFCTPIFTLDGKFVGVKILQIPELDLSSGNPLAGMSQMSDIQSMATGFILPAEAIRAATEKAATTSQPASSPATQPKEAETPKETVPPME